MARLICQRLKVHTMINMSEIIAITSGKGGSGKTTMAVNISCGLASLGKKVLLIDENNGLRSHDLFLKVDNPPIYNFVDYINGKCSYKDAIVKDKKYGNLYLLMASQTDAGCFLDSVKIKEKYTELKQFFDIIIIDTPYGVSNDFISSLSGVDRAIIVTNNNQISVRNADKIKSILIKQKIFNISLIVNKIDFDLLKKKAALTKGDIDEILGLVIIAEIPVDFNFPLSLNNRESLIDTNTKASSNILNICNLIIGNKLNDHVLISDKKSKGIRNIFGNLFKK